MDVPFGHHRGKKRRLDVDSESNPTHNSGQYAWADGRSATIHGVDIIHDQSSHGHGYQAFMPMTTFGFSESTFAEANDGISLFQASMLGNEGFSLDSNFAPNGSSRQCPHIPPPLSYLEAQAPWTHIPHSTQEQFMGFQGGFGSSTSIGELSVPFEGADALLNPLPANQSILDESGAGVRQVPEQEREFQIVCFGMVSGILARCTGSSANTAPGPFSVQFKSSGSFQANEIPDIRGTVTSDHVDVVCDMIKAESLELHAFCTVDDTKPPRGVDRKYAQMPCQVNIVVTGSSELLDEIGPWFEQYDVYLQDPRFLVEDVKYCNPHRLSFTDLERCPLVSQVVSQSFGAVHLRDIANSRDVLDSYFGSDADLEETEQPGIIKTTLQRHQKQAMTFMLRRERGWAMESPYKDMWGVVHNEQGEFFLNTVSEVCHRDPPPQMCGGIIADPMGLGKTLAVISLVAYDMIKGPVMQVDTGEQQSTKPSVSATLIIVPPPLLDNWKGEIEKHVKPGFMRYRRHHGRDRLSHFGDVEAVQVVLTTFHTVAAEWTPRSGTTSILFSVQWNRIVLDEAHVIRNEGARMSRAVCDLEGVSRWAVTGTPIQNQLGDLAALLKFIRAYPYHEKSRFEADISAIWKEGRDKEAVDRLRRLSSCLLLRRPKNTIKLPPKRDMECAIDLTKEERDSYDALRDTAISKVDEALLQSSDVNRTGFYANVLQQIESLRLFCNLGLHYHSRHDKNKWTTSSSSNPDWSTTAQSTFNTCLQQGPIRCSQCSSSLDINQTLLDDPASQDQWPLFSSCLKFFCRECTSKLTQRNRPIDCGHHRACTTAPVSTSIHTLEDFSGEIAQANKSPTLAVPSKVRALVTDIQAQPADVKCVVFSTWRLTLNVVKAGLDQASIASLRFDGKVPQQERTSVLERFKTDPSIRVLLLTISCGAVGLTLTEASRAYLMEPHWNPTLEEQALGRIYRLGQTKEVTTIRFFVRNSFEEHVMGVQNSKKDLAGIFLSPHDGAGGEARNSIDRLHKLRSLL